MSGSVRDFFLSSFCVRSMPGPAGRFDDFQYALFQRNVRLDGPALLAGERMRCAFVCGSALRGASARQRRGLRVRVAPPAAAVAVQIAVAIALLAQTRARALQMALPMRMARRRSRHPARFHSVQAQGVKTQRAPRKARSLRWPVHPSRNHSSRHSLRHSPLRPMHPPRSLCRSRQYQPCRARAGLHRPCRSMLSAR
jgi:hypothetical protein